jgi:hypothetical protein
VGHFINDLVAACWFNYLLFFLKRVVKTEAAPAALLAGQIADGLATPIVGLLSDRTKTKYGTICNHFRPENSLVCGRNGVGGCLLHPHLSDFHQREQSQRVRLLYDIPSLVQHRLGCPADQSHEFGAIAHLLPQATSKTLHLFKTS